MNKITVEIDADKLNAIRRKFSFQHNKDFTANDVIDWIIHKELAGTRAIPKKPRQTFVYVNTNEVLKELQKGTTGQAISDKLGCSLSTVWRHKAKLLRDGVEL
jgi:DNA-binding NarL/FixJ family response regulator